MMPSRDPLRVTYELRCERGERPELKAVGIAYEQTVELPDDCLGDAERDRAVGEVVELEALGEGIWRAVICYTSELVGGSMVQLLNLLYGNISLQRGIRLVEVDWPAPLFETFRGPRFGMGGLRDLCRVGGDRPILCGVAKPLGLSSEELARRCGEMALGGVDLIKDDHSLGDQAWAPFAERVERCQTAIDAANRESGGSTVYFPTLAASGDGLARRAELLRSIGSRGATVLPVYMGLDVIRDLAEGSALALLGHPSGSGAFFSDDMGISPEVLLGQIYRLAGCDVVNFPRAGGRFALSAAAEGRLVHNLKAPLGPLEPAAPAPGGSVSVETIEPWMDLYGADAVFVVGASLFRGAQIRQNARRLAAAIGRL